MQGNVEFNSCVMRGSVDFNKGAAVDLLRQLTRQLIFVLVFTYAKSRFPHDASQIMLGFSSVTPTAFAFSVVIC